MLQAGGLGGVGRRAGAVAVAAHGMCPAAPGCAWVHVRACALCGDQRRNNGGGDVAAGSPAAARDAAVGAQVGEIDGLYEEAAPSV